MLVAHGVSLPSLRKRAIRLLEDSMAAARYEAMNVLSVLLRRIRGNCMVKQDTSSIAALMTTNDERERHGIINELKKGGELFSNHPAPRSVQGQRTS